MKRHHPERRQLWVMRDDHGCTLVYHAYCKIWENNRIQATKTGLDIGGKSPSGWQTRLTEV